MIDSFGKALLFALLSIPIAAQCPLRTLKTSVYGDGCSEVAGSATLSATLETGTCELLVAVVADNGCCNTFLTGTALVVGFSPASMPLPMLSNPTCALLVDPAFALGQAGSQAPQIHRISIPPALPSVKFYVQGIASYATTIHFPAPSVADFSLTAGLEIGVQ